MGPLSTVQVSQNKRGKEKKDEGNNLKGQSKCKLSPEKREEDTEVFEVVLAFQF